MLEFNKVLKQGDIIYSGSSLNTITKITNDSIEIDGKHYICFDDVRTVNLSYCDIMINIIKSHEKKGFVNVITDLHYNIGLSDFTKNEFREFHKNNKSNAELYKHMKYVSFPDKNKLGLTAHPLILKYLQSFHLNISFKENITSELLLNLLYGMSDSLYGDLFKPVTEKLLIYKDTKFITDIELRKMKINEILNKKIN